MVVDNKNAHIFSSEVKENTLQSFYNIFGQIASIQIHSIVKSFVLVIIDQTTTFAVNIFEDFFF